MRDQLRGCVRINVEGRQLYSFVNELHERGISCFSQYVKGGIFTAEIYRHDLRRIETLAFDMGLTVKSFELDTLSSRFLHHKRRVGFLVGIVLVIAAFVYFSGVIVRIDIEGNERVDTADILCALEELDIHEGTRFGSIDYVNSENRLRLMVDGISWVGMRRSGQRLVVEVTEPVEKPEMLRSRIPCNLIAAHDAEIVSVSVLDGMLMRLIGDHVMTGDLLVSGVTKDSAGHVLTHHAMGSIIGIYDETVRFAEDFEVERFVTTDEECRTRLYLLGLEIPLYFGQNQWSCRDTETVLEHAYAFGRELPIGLKRTIYRKKERSQVSFTEEELERQLSERIYLYEKNFLQDCEIISREIEKTVSDESLTLTVRYKLKGDICRESEILAK